MDSRPCHSALIFTSQQQLLAHHPETAHIAVSGQLHDFAQAKLKPGQLPNTQKYNLNMSPLVSCSNVGAVLASLVLNVLPEEQKSVLAASSCCQCWLYI